MLQSSAMLQSVCQPPAAVVRQNLKVVHVNIGQGQSGYCGSSQARTTECEPQTPAILLQPVMLLLEAMLICSFTQESCWLAHSTLTA